MKKDGLYCKYNSDLFYFDLFDLVKNIFIDKFLLIKSRWSTWAHGAMNEQQQIVAVWPEEPDKPWRALLKYFI